MNFGENIYRLRTEKNLSQGDLADALEVSRQSVSKWENNSAVPELDKLIKMSDLFGVTLDELVGNAATSAQRAMQTIPSVDFPELPSKVSGIIPGIVFLCAGLLVWLLIHFLYALPLFVCGALCLCMKRRWGLWCCWVLLFSVSCWLYSYVGVGINAFWAHLADAFDSTAGLHRLLTSLAVNIAIVGMVIWSIRTYMGDAMRLAASGKSRLLLGWCLAYIPNVLVTILVSFNSLMFKMQHESVQIFSYVLFLLYWIRMAGIIVILVRSIGFIKYHKELHQTLVRKGVCTIK